jgi:hypothetical protein
LALIAFSSLADSVNWARNSATRRGNFLRGGGFAEAGNIRVFGRAFFSAPCVVSADDFFQIGFGQFTMDAIHERAQFAGVNE